MSCMKMCIYILCGEDKKENPIEIEITEDEQITNKLQKVRDFFNTNIFRRYYI